jgi:hypothetical protein
MPVDPFVYSVLITIQLRFLLTSLWIQWVRGCYPPLIAAGLALLGGYRYVGVAPAFDRLDMREAVGTTYSLVYGFVLASCWIVYCVSVFFLVVLKSRNFVEGWTIGFVSVFAFLRMLRVRSVTIDVVSKWRGFDLCALDVYV